jgi:hypothetical protein
MFELGGTTATPGVVVLALCLVAATTWVAWRRPGGVVVLATSVAAVHALAYATAYLDAAQVASVRTAAAGLAAAAFLAVAGALDAVFAAIRRAIMWFLDALAAVSMPGTAASVLEFGAFLLAAAVVSACVCGAVVLIVEWAEGSPLGGGLAALGVVFGAIGILWTWFPVPPAELSAVHALSIAGAVGAGVVLGTVATGAEPMPAIREHMRAYR